MSDTTLTYTNTTGEVRGQVVSDTTHTLGPWHMHAELDKFRIEQRKDGHCYYYIADVINANKFAVNEANARLIAAAPDLLEGLKNLLAECERQGCFADVSIEHPMIKPVFDAARAAIAKAEGT